MQQTKPQTKTLMNMKDDQMNQMNKEDMRVLLEELRQQVYEVSYIT